MVVKPWLLLVYRIPREPTASRVYVWRKLKQLGAVSIQDAAWVLPRTTRTTRTQEQFQWLAAEISELGGEAMLLEAEQLYATNEDSLRQQFVEPVEAEYRDILKSLQRKKRDFPELSKRYQQALARDYFQSKAEFVFIPRGAAIPADAEPFDIPGVVLSHHDGHCSFHAFLRKYKLKDRVLERIARIVDEADTIQEVSIEPAAAGLDLICEGLRLVSPDDGTRNPDLRRTLCTSGF